MQIPLGLAHQHGDEVMGAGKVTPYRQNQHGQFPEPTW